MFHIIEDDSETRATMVAFVKLLGHVSYPFATPSAYIDHLHSYEYTPPKAVITELHLADINGYELIKQTLQKYPETRFIVTLSKHHIENHVKEKICLTLHKPFSLNGLREVISKIVSCEETGPSPDIGCASVGNIIELAQPHDDCPRHCSECND